MHFFRELSGFPFCDLGKEGEGEWHQGYRASWWRSAVHYETHNRPKISQHGHAHHTVTASGCEQPPETGSRQYGTFGTEAQTPFGSGAGNEEKAGNPESR